MRTTLTIDDDVLTAARHLASDQGQSVGLVISNLARSALQPRPESGAMRNGVPLLPNRQGAPTVTLDIVNRLRDEGP